MKTKVKYNFAASQGNGVFSGNKFLSMREKLCSFLFFSIKFYTKLDHKEEEHIKIVSVWNRTWCYRLEYMRKINSFL